MKLLIEFENFENKVGMFCREVSKQHLYDSCFAQIWFDKKEQGWKATYFYGVTWHTLEGAKKKIWKNI